MAALTYNFVDNFKRIEKITKARTILFLHGSAAQKKDKFFFFLFLYNYLRHYYFTDFVFEARQTWNLYGYAEEETQTDASKFKLPDH